MMGYGIFALAYSGFALARSPAQAVLLFIFYGLYYGLCEGVGRAYASDLAPKETRATALGAYHTVTGIAALPASIFAGLLWDHVGAFAPFAFGAGLSIVALLLFAMLIKK
jgi:MFS family permease